MTTTSSILSVMIVAAIDVMAIIIISWFVSDHDYRLGSICLLIGHAIGVISKIISIHMSLRNKLVVTHQELKLFIQKEAERSNKEV